MRVMKCNHLDDCRKFAEAMKNYPGILPPIAEFVIDTSRVHCIDHTEKTGCELVGRCSNSGFSNCHCIEVEIEVGNDIRHCNHLLDCRKALEHLEGLDMPNLPEIDLRQDTHCTNHVAMDCCDTQFACDVTGYTDCACVSSSEVDK